MQITYGQFETVKYILRFPRNYNPEKSYPLILFLHGMGGRGDDISRFHNSQFLQMTEKLPEFPFITIMPRCNQDTWFDLFETLKGLVRDLVSKPFVDKNRVYLMGASMGGYTTWHLAMSMPEKFAAIVPICGGGMYANAARLKTVPVWAFHGKRDTTVLVEESQKMVDAVNRYGGRAKLTIYPENGHDAWSDTYQNPEVYRWLLSHSRVDSIIEV